MAISRSDSFGALLRHWRIAARLTQEELAERAGLSARGISDLERGIHLPQRATIRLLAQSLGIDESAVATLERAARGTPDRASTEPGATGSLPPLVGRTAELALLGDHLAGTSAPLLALGGEPGIGKSRLLYEAEQLGKARGITVLSGGAGAAVHRSRTRPLSRRSPPRWPACHHDNCTSGCKAAPGSHISCRSCRSWSLSRGRQR